MEPHANKLVCIIAKPFGASQLQYVGERVFIFGNFELATAQGPGDGDQTANVQKPGCASFSVRQLFPLRFLWSPL
jgi:hypothetical protein